MAASVHSGTLTNVNDAVTIASLAAASVLLEISGTYTGLQIAFETSPDGTVWGEVGGAACLGGSGAPAPSNQPQPHIADSASVVYQISALVVGAEFRVRCVAIASGSASVAVLG